VLKIEKQSKQLEICKT